MDFLALVDTFLENSFLPLYGATVLLSFIRYPKYYDTPLKYLPILLLYTLLNEILGYIISTNEAYALVFDEAYSTYTVAIYNVYNILFFSYFYYLFWCYLTKKAHRNVVFWGAIVFLFSAFINPFFQSFMLGNQIHAYFVGAVVLITAIILYWKQIGRAMPWSVLKKNVLFWLSLGLFVFYVGYLPIRINRHFHIINQTSEANYVRRIHLLLIIVMYVCFIVGFLNMRRRLILLHPVDQNDRS